MSSEFLFTGLSLDTLDEVVKVVDSMPINANTNNDILAIFGDKSTTQVINALIEGTSKNLSETTSVKSTTTASLENASSTPATKPATFPLPIAESGALVNPSATVIISNVPVAASNVPLAPAAPIITNLSPSTASIVPLSTTTIVGPATASNRV